MADQIGELDIRGENIERAVKGFMNKLYKLKPLLMIQSSDKWTETYYRETNTPLAALGNRNVNQVARGALPPEVHPSWTEVNTTQRKFMAQGLVFYEDKLTNAIDTQARTIFRVAESIVNAVDLYIYTQLTAATSTSGDVQSLDDWNSATIANRDPISDILIGEGAMMTNYYDVVGSGAIIMKAVNYASLLRNSKVINNPSFKTADVVSNGVMGQVAGLDIVVSENCDADEAMIIMKNRAATWKEVVPVTSVVIEDQGISFKIRTWTMGHIQITDPEGIYVIEQIDVNV